VLNVAGLGVEPELDLCMVPLSTKWPDTRIENSAIEIGARLARSALNFSLFFTILVDLNEFNDVARAPTVFGTGAAL
jgi:hypothetical protein